MVQQQKLNPEFMVLCVKLVEQLRGLSNIQENVSGNKQWNLNSLENNIN